jgi:hypothetical protein
MLLTIFQICSTREEWERIAERFENAAHYAEKALYKLLTKHIVPAVIEDFEVCNIHVVLMTVRSLSTRCE